MEVQRLSFPALKKVLNGQLTQKATCVVKFYASNCPYCHALKEYYDEIAESYEDIYFFAFNTDDARLDGLVKINGVPSVALVRYNGLHRPKVHLLGEPQEPNKFTWYRSKDITDFIEKHKNG